MRIGFDAKRYFNNSTGLGNYSRDLIRVLETYHPQSTYYLYTPNTPTNCKLDNIRTPQNFLEKKLSAYWRYKGIVKDLAKDKIDLYHGLSAEIPVGLKAANIPSVVTIHDLIFVRYPELYKTIDRTIYLAKARYAAKRSDKIIAISQQTKADIINFLGVAEEKIEVIYQGCHSTFKVRRTDHQKTNLIRSYGLPQDFILNVGTIEARKNLLQIVKAIKNIDMPLVVVGKKTVYFEEVYKYILANSLQNKVIFLHGLSIDELATLYQCATTFVYPSVFEGFGIPIIEALYSGTPVITTNSGVFPEAGGPSSHYIDLQKENDLEQALSFILESKEKREEMSAKGLEYAQRFNDEKVANQTYQLYKETLINYDNSLF